MWFIALPLRTRGELELELAELRAMPKMVIAQYFTPGKADAQCGSSNTLAR
jgi:hypothetical protein